MNKRMRFILAILTFLFSINCQVDNSAFLNAHARELCISTFQQKELPFTLNFNNEQKKEHKNAIRIKAWDDATPINIPTHWIPQPITFYFIAAFYLNYSSPTFQISGS